MGNLYFILSIAVAMFSNFDDRKTNTMSAYSIFNSGCQRILGTITAEQFERERIGNHQYHDNADAGTDHKSDNENDNNASDDENDDQGDQETKQRDKKSHRTGKKARRNYEERKRRKEQYQRLVAAEEERYYGHYEGVEDPA